MDNRPSIKELEQKIKLARKLLDNGQWIPIDKRVFLTDCREIGICTNFDRIDALKEVMHAIGHSDYAGKRPPQKSYDGKIINMELFAFTKYVETLKENVYVKFAVSEQHLFVVSFHKVRKRC